MGESVQKVRGGKLLRIRLDSDGKAIRGIVITGDFFIYPEEGLAQLEEGLVGARLDNGAGQLIDRIASILADRSITVLGFGPSDLARTILEAR